MPERSSVGRGSSLQSDWISHAFCPVLPYVCMFRSPPAARQVGSRYPEKDCPISYLWVKPWLYSELVAKRIGYRFSLHPIVFHFSQPICTYSVPDRLKFRAFLTESFQNLNLLSPVWRMGMVWEAFVWLHQLVEGILG